MNYKRIFILILFIFTPNICYAYVDPGIIALVWQSIIAFIFAVLAYFRFFYAKTSNFIKKIPFFFKKKLFLTLFDCFSIFLVLFIPILQVINKNKIYFGHLDYINAIFSLLIIYLVILLVFYMIFRFLKKDTGYLLYYSMILMLSMYFVTSGEEYVITNYLDTKNMLYFRIFILILFPILSLVLFNLFIKIKLSNVRIFLFSFLICLVSISSIDFFNTKDYSSKIDNKLWKYPPLEATKTALKDNIYLIFTDAYLSPNYFNILYPNTKNELFDIIIDKKFYLKDNALSNYSSTRFSIPSIFNSNYFSPKMTMDRYKSSFEDANNILDNSFLTQSLKKNNYNKKFFQCDFEYMFKKRYCKERRTYLSLINDISIIDSIYYYNSFYILYKKVLLTLYKNKFFRNVTDKITKNDEGEILSFLNNEIKNTKDKKKNFFTIVFSKPHVPWILNKDCSWKNIPLSENTKNGYLIKDENIRINGYIDNLQCINNYLIKLIEKIESHDDEAIIILLSDNGPFVRPNKYLKNKISKNEVKLYDFNSTLFSVGGGSKCLRNINKKDLSHVNLFRIIFNCEKNKKFKLLENVTYINPISGVERFDFKEAEINE